MEEGLRLAAECNHPDALWLCSLFPSGVIGCAEAADVFLASGRDGRSLCYAGLVTASLVNPSLIAEAAQLGYPLAQAEWAKRVVMPSANETAVVWAESSAAQGEVEGMVVLARWLFRGALGESEVPRGRVWALKAAEMGSGEGQHIVAMTCDADDPQRFRWLGKAALGGFSWSISALAKALPEQLVRYDTGSSGKCLFEIGAAFKYLVFECACTSQCGERIRRVVAMYDAWCELAKQAIETWQVVGLRSGTVNRDIRLKVAKMMWCERGAWSDVRVAPSEEPEAKRTKCRRE
jgi:hypothetical protein